MMYIKKLLIVCIITLTAAYATGLIFDHIYKERWSQLFFIKTDELTKGSTNYDILFFGNSRVHFGINPFYIDAATKLNSYNFGYGGADQEEIMLTSTLYLQQHKAPKLVIISLDMGSLLKNIILKTRFHYLFYLENDTINKHLQQAGFLTPLIKIFPFAKYSFFDEYNRTSLFVKGNQLPVFSHNIYKGFINIHQNIKTNAAGLYNVKTDSLKLWNNSIAYLRNTVVALQKAGSMVVFVSPPEKITSPNRKENFKKIADSIFTSIATDYHLNYLHFENDPSFTADYFVDDIHLNEPGTRIYSLQLADSIKKIYPYQKKKAF